MLIQLKPSRVLAGLVLTFSICFSASSSASLVNNGNGLIYDTALNITWTQDANLFKTMAAGNTNIVNQIIAANNGLVHDTPNYSDTVRNSGVYQLSASDFNTSTGEMNWWGSQAWARFLNSSNYGGSSQWRSPTTPLSAQINPFHVTTRDVERIATSDLGELFYKEIGGIIGSSIEVTHNDNYNLFTNIALGSYWSDTEYRYPDNTVCWGGAYYNADCTTYTGSTNYAWYLYTQNGGLFVNPKSYFQYAWAVTPGNVGAVPVPAAIWLFGSGLLGLTGLARKRKATQ